MYSARMLLTACRKNTATSGQSTQNLCSKSQHHQAFTADSWCTKHSKKKKKKLETTLCYSICLWEVILEIFICLMIGEITRVRAVTED